MIGLLAIAAILFGVAFGVLTGLAVFSGGLLVLFVYHLRKLDALTHWARQPVGTPGPRALGLWGRAFADLERSARVAQESRERLSTGLQRFRQAGQAMPDGVMFLSQSDRIEWINRKAEQHFMLDGTRDIGVPVTHLLRQPEFVAYLAAGDFTEPVVMHSPRSAGPTLLVQIVPFGNDQKMVVSRDISQIEKLETMRRDFIANVSHELRTPLTVVSGFLETLIDGLDDFSRDDVLRYLKLAHDQSLRMQSLIEDLLTLSALETGAPAPCEEEIDIGALVREVAEDTRLLSADRHTVELDMPAEADACMVLGSRKELCSAFANLASNAVRYTPEGGRVRLSWRLVGDEGEFAVEDTGIGIAPHHIPRLTERFYRVDRGRSRDTGGTGLGLAIVKHILSRHQCRLDIVSEPGQGSRFSVCLPAARLRRATRSLRS